MAYNVLGSWRFASPYKGFAKQRPGLAKCGGVKPCRGRKPEHGFTEPEGANSARSSYRLLDEVRFFFITVSSLQ